MIYLLFQSERGKKEYLNWEQFSSSTKCDVRDTREEEESFRLIWSWSRPLYLLGALDPPHLHVPNIALSHGLTPKIGVASITFFLFFCDVKTKRRKEVEENQLDK